MDSGNRSQQAASGIRENHWQRYSDTIGSLAATGHYDFVISASRDGDFAQVRPGRTFKCGEAPPAKEVEHLIAHALAAQSLPYVDFVALDDCPILHTVNVEYRHLAALSHADLADEYSQPCAASHQ